MCADMPTLPRSVTAFVSTATRRKARSPGGSSSATATEKNFLSPITTKPWGTAIPKLADVPGPSKEMRDGHLLYNEPRYIRMDDGDLHTLASAGLKLKKGVYY